MILLKYSCRVVNSGDNEGILAAVTASDLF